MRDFLGRLGLLALVLTAIGCAGEDAADETPPGPASSVSRIRLGGTFPEMELVGPDGEASPPSAWRGGWRVVALCPLTAPNGLDNIPEWESHRRIWADLGLDLIVITEGEPVDADDARRCGGRILHSRTSVFRVTGVLNRPVHVLIDPEGEVRHLDRPGVEFSAQLRSLLLNYRTLSAPERDREAIVRGAFPGADSVAVLATSEAPWLASDAFDLGLSAWYGEAFGRGGRLGRLFPIEFDPQCTTCDLLYLAVGVGRSRRIVAVNEIEPIIALGEHISADRLFGELIGIGKEEDLKRIGYVLARKKAEDSIHSVIRVALTLAARIPDEPVAD